MVNYIWVFLAASGIIYAMWNGTMDEVNEAIFNSADDAVMLTISLISVLVFWLGLMKIARGSRIIKTS